MKNPEESIKDYRQALVEVVQQGPPPQEDSLLSAIKSREAMQHSLSEFPCVAAHTLTELADLDRMLSVQAARLTATQETRLKSWCEAAQPQNPNWWWKPDKYFKPNPMWGLVSLILVTLAIGFTAEVIRRSVGSGVDLLNIGAQTLLALLAGSAFTQFGQELIEKLLARFGVKWRRQPVWKALLAAGALAVAAALYLALPALAKIYTNNLGVRFYQEGAVDKAVRSYERAISLDPDYAQAHYNLGTAYESSLELDKATAAYQVALRNDPKFYYAHNNLARLYLLRGGEVASANALTVLNTALAQRPPEPAVLYALYKNRAWAHLNLKLYGTAAEDLKAAFRLQPDGAAAYCLQALLHEAQGKPAIDDWGNCLANKTGQEAQLEAVWLSTAQEKLRKGGSK